MLSREIARCASGRETLLQSQLLQLCPPYHVAATCAWAIIEIQGTHRVVVLLGTRDQSREKKVGSDNLAILLIDVNRAALASSCQLLPAI